MLSIGNHKTDYVYHMSVLVNDFVELVMMYSFCGDIDAYNNIIRALYTLALFRTMCTLIFYFEGILRRDTCINVYI